MLYLYAAQQFIISAIIYCFLGRTVSLPKRKKRIFLLAPFYCITYALLGIIFQLYVIKSLHGIIFFAYSIFILRLCMRLKFPNLITRWAMAYIIVTILHILGKLAAFIFCSFLCNTEEYTVVYGVSLVFLSFGAILTGLSKAVKKLFDKAEQGFSLRFTLALWIGSVTIIAMLESNSYIKDSQMASSHVWQMLLIHAILVVVAIICFLDRNKDHVKNRAAEKQIHEYRHIVRSAVPPHQMQDLRVYEAQLADVEDLAPTGSELCDGCIHNAARQCHAEGIGFDLTVNALLTSCVKSNKIGYVQLEMILDNLLQNAIDASHPGGQIEVILMEDHSGIYQIVMCDDGDPIDPYVLKHWGTDGITTKENGNGFGIGEIITSLSASAASFYVYQPRPGGELKCLTIRFDGKGEMAIKDKRDETRRDEPVQDSQNG